MLIYLKHCLFLLVLVVLSLDSHLAYARSPSDAARTFIESLSEHEAKFAILTFNNQDRYKIRYTPGVRSGLTFRTMDTDTRTKARELLDSALSSEGSKLVANILQREKILWERSEYSDYRNPELYYLAIFGKPGKGRWGFRFEGHHLSINMTYMMDKLIAGSPLMIGSNPEKVDIPDIPSILLTPLVEAARKATQNDEARLELINSLTSYIPNPFRTQYRKELIKRHAFSKKRKTWRGFDLSGGNISLVIETNQTNHFHITFRDKLKDFGGE